MTGACGLCIVVLLAPCFYSAVIVLFCCDDGFPFSERSETFVIVTRPDFFEHGIGIVFL